ncbi:MAG: ankyrin repeat domain-containing protein [Phycisphaerae bacterium]|nr:ankyrin repeat domain-containing protein [Phycisphaerae bacterium]
MRHAITMRRAITLAAATLLLFCPSSILAADGTDIHTAARLGHVARVKELLDADPGLVNARTAAGETPLHYAAATHDRAVIELLLSRGAKVAAVDGRGLTPLHLVATSWDPDLIRMVLAAGADPSAADVRGETPLHMACRRLNEDSMRVLIAAGAKVNARNDRGQAPMHVLGLSARRHDRIHALYRPLAMLLIENGADPRLLDEDGVPAFREPKDEPPPSRDDYRDYAEIAQILADAETNYPAICQRHDLGLSVQGRHLWALNISDNVGTEEDEPEFKYVSTMHGDEWTGNEMCLFLIDYLLTNYGTDPRITNIIDEIDIWIVPLMNPDGFEHTPSPTRENANGVDLNRNFPEGSDGDPNTTDGRAAETAVIMNWTFANSFTCSANFHTGAIVVNYPFDDDNKGSTFSPTPDEDMFVYISEEYSKTNLPMWNGGFYHGITNGADWYTIDGGMQDWHYRYMGCNEVTIELNNYPKIRPYSEIPDLWDDNRESMMAYMETCLIGIRGVVTGLSGEPLACTVTVAGRDHEVYTDPDVGDYHRMLMPGTYDLTFDADGQDPVTYYDVVVNEGPATRLDVSFGPGPPVTQDVSVGTGTSEPVDITLLATDDGLPDPPAALTYIVTSLPTHTLKDAGNDHVITAGELPYTLVANGNQVTYVPGTGSGSYSFEYKANDGGTPPDGGDSNVSTVYITVGGPQAVYAFPLDSDPGWATQGEWAFGQPTGDGGAHGYADPDSGATGVNVYGIDLSGDYSTSVGGPYWLTAGPLDLSGITDVTLKFQRWLNTDYQPYVYATIEVSTNGSDWTPVWDNGGSAIEEDGWTEQVFDISDWADNEAGVHIRWGHEIGQSGAYAYSGWNIDDIEIWGLATDPCDGVLPGDVHVDGVVNGLDIQAFVDVVLDPDGPWPSEPDGHWCAADTVPDHNIDMQDVDAFILLLLATP